MDENIREQIVAEALDWCGTPWHHEANVKGSGVDCAQLLRSVFSNVGATVKPTEHYPQDWHMNRKEERFMNFVLEYASEITEADLLPGDIILWRVGRCYSHGGIYIGNRKIVHAIVTEGTTRVGSIDESPLSLVKRHPRKCFRWKELTSV